MAFLAQQNAEYVSQIHQTGDTIQSRNNYSTSYKGNQPDHYFVSSYIQKFGEHEAVGEVQASKELKVLSI